MKTAFLDIETTGLSPNYDEITVIGLYIEENEKCKIIQLVEDSICANNLILALKNVDLVYTYNGKRFDLPFIKAKLDVDIAARYKHNDLMYYCHRCDLYGGLKVVEKRLGIRRKLPDIDGIIAVQLWYEYQRGSKKAFQTLLEYNREDVLNLKLLLCKLNQFIPE